MEFLRDNKRKYRMLEPYIQRKIAGGFAVCLKHHFGRALDPEGRRSQAMNPAAAFGLSAPGLKEEARQLQSALSLENEYIQKAVTHVRIRAEKQTASIAPGVRGEATGRRERVFAAGYPELGKAIASEAPDNRSAISSHSQHCLCAGPHCRCNESIETDACHKQKAPPWPGAQLPEIHLADGTFQGDIQSTYRMQG